MSNEVYFNEPGYESTMGTPSGEALNNGYKNVCKWGTLKYAILGQIQKPPLGFEDLVRRNFFLKKDVILAEIDEWLTTAKTDETQWCHFNSTIENRFAQSKEKFHDEIVELRAELVKEFEKMRTPWESSVEDNQEEEKLDIPRVKSVAALPSVSIPPPPIINVKVPPVPKPEVKPTVAGDEQDELDKVDVSYKAEIATQEKKEININDDDVKDRWSRYIGAMGIEAVAKQAESTVLLSGLGGLGVEIAKNLVLAGCKELILHDKFEPSFNDLASQFFIEEDEVKDTKG
jgi:hypothetical protein